MKGREHTNTILMKTGEELVSQRYVLPAAAVIETMKNANVVRLQTHVPPLPGQTEESTAELVVGQGKIHSCCIVTKSGAPLFMHAEALKVLEQLGDLEWSIYQAPTDIAGAIRRKGEEIPRRMVPCLSLAQEQVLSRREKQVFALVDGKRSIETIAHILHLESSAAQEILQKLREVYAID